MLHHSKVATELATIDYVRNVEGIEEYNQFRLLRELGCDVAQGYLIARPLDDKALASALNDYVKKCSWFGEV